MARISWKTIIKYLKWIEEQLSRLSQSSSISSFTVSSYSSSLPLKTLSGSCKSRLQNRWGRLSRTNICHRTFNRTFKIWFQDRTIKNQYLLRMQNVWQTKKEEDSFHVKYYWVWVSTFNWGTVRTLLFLENRDGKMSFSFMPSLATVFLVFFLKMGPYSRDHFN